MSDVVDPLAHMSSAPAAPRKTAPAKSSAKPPAKKAPVAPVSVPEPQDGPTPEQARIAELEAKLAALEAKASASPELVQYGDFEDAKSELVEPEDRADNILIHFVADGFTALGQVWYRGQEIEFTPGSGAYEDTKDRNGKSWLDLRDDEYAQIDRYGEQKFRSGPWRGKTYRAAAGTFEKREGVEGPGEEELLKAERAEARRRRAAPRIKV